MPMSARTAVAMGASFVPRAGIHIMGTIYTWAPPTTTMPTRVMFFVIRGM